MPLWRPSRPLAAARRPRWWDLTPADLPPAAQSSARPLPWARGQAWTYGPARSSLTSADLLLQSQLTSPPLWFSCSLGRRGSWMRPNTEISSGVKWKWNLFKAELRRGRPSAELQDDASRSEEELRRETRRSGFITHLENIFHAEVQQWRNSVQFHTNCLLGRYKILLFISLNNNSKWNDSISEKEQRRKLYIIWSKQRKLKWFLYININPSRHLK